MASVEQCKHNTQTLEAYLQGWAGQDNGKLALKETLLAISLASVEISDLISRGALAGDLAAMTGGTGGGDAQKTLDLMANDIFLKHVAKAPVSAFASEEVEEAVDFQNDEPFVVAVDPLDGSSNIDTNVTVGLVFSVLPKLNAVSGDLHFLQPGHRQVGAGVVLFGPQTTFLLTVCDGAHVFTFDSEREQFVCTTENVVIPPTTQEYAINDSNYRHWDEAVRTYIDDCRLGEDGPRTVNFNMRWVGSFVAEISRIFSRGGIYLYPGDKRPGYQRGRLRMVYEVNPVALLIEQAGGVATTGHSRVLDIVPRSLHARAPLICGSRDEVKYMFDLYSGPEAHGERSPLFRPRSFFYF